MQVWQKIKKWFSAGTKMERTRISPGLPGVQADEVIAIHYPKALIRFKMFVMIVFLIAVYFATHVLVSVALAIFFLYISYREWYFRTTPLLIIDKNGIRYKKDFFAWNNIHETWLRIIDSDLEDSRHIILHTATGEKEIYINGLNRPWEEIEHYVESFRTKQFL